LDCAPSRHLAVNATVVLVVVMATVNGLKAFVFQKVMTDGGPADSTEILTLLIYKTAFSYLNMGRAGAYSILLFTAILAISLAQI
jgi:ABC-type sugar transport system permease subunit